MQSKPSAARPLAESITRADFRTLDSTVYYADENDDRDKHEQPDGDAVPVTHSS